MKQITFL